MFRTPKVTAIGKGPSHRATENGIGTETASNCCSLSNLNSPATMWTDEGFCSPLRHNYLLMGLEVRFSFITLLYATIKSTGPKANL